MDSDFLLEISKADTIHDWGARGSGRVSDLDECAIVKKYLEYIGISLKKWKSPASSGLPKVSYNDIEDTYTEYVVEKLHMTKIIDNVNALDLTPLTAVSDFYDVSDASGCKSMRVRLSDSTNLNKPEQYDEIGKKIFKYFGVDEINNGKLHLIIDAASGKLNSHVYDKDRQLYKRLFININALNIADSAVTRNSAGNIVHNFFPFHFGHTTSPTTIDGKLNYPATGRYELNNWSLAEAEMNEYLKQNHHFIFAYYTNEVPADIAGWQALPFNDNVNCYHISMKVGITTTKGDDTTLIQGIHLWESSFVQSGGTNIQTTQGASINTLSGLIKQIDDTNVPKITSDDSTNEFDLSPILNGFKKWLTTKNVPILTIKRILVSFIFDYKRSGDHEQVLSCKLMIDQGKDLNPPITYVLSTGDQLCALWARYNQVSCIWHHDHKMDLYSFHRDNPSKRREIRLKLLKEARDLYIKNKTTLNPDIEEKDKDGHAMANVDNIVKMHMVDGGAYAELESVKIYNAYLQTMIVVTSQDESLQQYYEDLIEKCGSVIEDISKNTVLIADDYLDNIQNNKEASVIDIKELLDGSEWLVPNDKYALFIEKITSCKALSVDEWKKTIEQETKKDIFGFTLYNHITLRKKYVMLKKAHDAYKQEIFNAWRYPGSRDNFPSERPEEDDDKLIDSGIKYYLNTKNKYDTLTKNFLRKSGTILFAEIFGSMLEKHKTTGLITEILDMNSLFKPTTVKTDNPILWYVRGNCHNTGGSYYGISAIATFLEDPSGRDRMNSGHPENLEPKLFYTTTPPDHSNWLATGAIATSLSGGGKYYDELTHVSAPKFIDYIENIRSNIVSDLNLDCVGINVNGKKFQNYIIKSVKNLYLKYNQTDYAPADVHRLLEQLGGALPSPDEIILNDADSAIIYKYSILLYNKIYPDDSLSDDSSTDSEYNQEDERERSPRKSGLQATNKQSKSYSRPVLDAKEAEKKAAADAKAAAAAAAMYAFIPASKKSFFTAVYNLQKLKELESDSTPAKHDISADIDQKNILGVPIYTITAQTYKQIVIEGLSKDFCVLRSRRLIHSPPLPSQVRQSPSRSQVSLMHIDASKPPLKPKTGNYTVVSNLGRGTKRTSDNRDTPKEGKHINPLSRLSESPYYKNISPNKENISNKMSTGSYNDTNAFFKFNSASPIRIEPSTRSDYTYSPDDAGHMDVGPSIRVQSSFNPNNKRLRLIRGGHKYTTKTNRNKVRFNFTRLNHNKKHKINHTRKHKINYTRKHNRNVTRKHKMHRKQTRKHRNRR